MSKKLNKTLKIAGLSIGAVLLSILLLLTAVIHFIFTPEKLTPLVLKTANATLDAHLELQRAELTFFSTFPRFTVELKEGALVSNALRDSAYEKTDSLLTFGRCLVEVHPLDYLTKKEVRVGAIRLEQAKVYAFRDAEGRANWDIVQSSTETSEDSVSQEGVDLKAIALDGIRLKESQVIFDDRSTRLYARMDSIHLEMHAAMDQDHSKVALRFDNRNVLCWHNGELLVSGLRTGLQTDLGIDHHERKVTLQDTRLDVNGLVLDVSGTLQPDTTQKALLTDLDYRLHTPSLATLLTLLPESVVKKADIKAAGEVSIEGKLAGQYGQRQLPQLTMAVHIKDAAAHYEGMPYGIDKIDLDFKAHVDPMRTTPSYANLRIFRFEGAHTHVAADARIDALLDDPNIRLNVKSNVDLTALAKTFPLQEGVSLKGGVEADLSLQCRLSSLKRQDWGRVRLQGNLKMKDMAITDVNKGFDLHSDASFLFKGKDELSAALTIQQLQLKSKALEAAVNRMQADVKSGNPQDTTRIVPMEGSFEVNELKGHLGDSLTFFGNKAKAHVQLSPSKAHQLLPVVSVSLDADSLFGRMGETRIAMDKGGFGLRVTKLNDSIWSPVGTVGFRKLQLRTPELRLPVEMQKTQVTLQRQDLLLKEAKMKIGKSDLTATGAMYKVYDALKKRQPLRAKLTLTSEQLDGNQLIQALNTTTETAVAEETDSVSDAAPMELFILPKNIDFQLQTRLNKVTYGKMLFEHVQGDVDLRDQALHLKNLSMRGLDADMKATVVYHASEQQKGYTGFHFQLEKVNIGKLVDFIPSLDEMVPMLRSFKGIVNFDAAAEAELDSAMNIKIPSLRSAINIKGDSLVLMDGETFAEISKMMMFKNKKRNLIDSIYVNMTIDKGNVTVYPFVVQMDRYRAAVGGTQDLDMNFKYHISVLKSPVPFKLGVNITGNLDKMKFRVGKAKYKDMVTPVAIRKVDSTRINLGQNIVHDFEKVIKNAKKK